MAPGDGVAGSSEPYTGVAEDTCRQIGGSTRQRLGHSQVVYIGSGFLLSDNAQSCRYVEKDRGEREHEKDAARKLGPFAALG